MDLQVRVPIAEKVSAAHFSVERERVFGRAWLCVMHTADVAEPGSYAIIEVPTLKTSLLITHAKDGEIRAFHNVCTHRGNKLVRAGNGCRNQFTC